MCARTQAGGHSSHANGQAVARTKILAHGVAGFVIAVAVVFPHASVRISLCHRGELVIPAQLPHIRGGAWVRLRATERVVLRKQRNLLFGRKGAVGDLQHICHNRQHHHEIHPASDHRTDLKSHTCTPVGQMTDGDTHVTASVISH